MNHELHESGANDVGDFLRGSANINGVKKGGTNIDPVIRGFKFSQLNVVLNTGQKIEGGCPNRMDPATAHVETEDIKYIQVIKGPYALAFGPSFGGMINLETQGLAWQQSEGIHVHATQGFESNGSGQKTYIRCYGKFKKLFYQISGGRKNYGNYSDGNKNEVSSAFNHFNSKAQLGIKISPNQKLSGSFEIANGWDVRFPSLSMDERLEDTRLMAMDYMIDSTSGTLQNLKIKLFRSEVHHEMDNKYRPFSDTVVAVSALDALSQGGRIKASWKINPIIFIGGLDFENMRKDGSRTKSMILQPTLPVKNEKLWNHAQIYNMGAFALLKRNWENWKMMLSARFDHNQASSDAIQIKHPSFGEIYYYSTDSISSEFNNISMSGGIDRVLNQRIRLSLALGRGVRSPDLTERFIILLPIGYDKFDYIGNPKLKPEINTQADLTLTYTSQQKGMLQINSFYSLVDDYISGQRLPPSVLKPLSKDVLGVKQFYNAGRARLRGFEVNYVTPDRTTWSGGFRLSYTYGTIDRAKQFVLNANNEVSDDVEIINDALTEIPPLEGSIFVAGYFAKGKLTSRLNLRVVAPQKHVSLASYEPKSPGFIVSNLHMVYQINTSISLIAGVKNILNKAYYEHLNRNIIGSNNNLYEAGRSFYINVTIDL